MIHSDDFFPSPKFLTSSHLANNLNRVRNPLRYGAQDDVELLHVFSICVLLATSISPETRNTRITRIPAKFADFVTSLN